MRWLRALIVAGWAISPTLAAPVPASAVKPSPVSRRLQATAEVFADQLLPIANRIVDQYVRPVQRQDLLAAALASLYERVRLSVPEAVIAELKACRTDEEVFLMLCRVREKLGDVEELRKFEDLLAACRGMARCLDRYSCLVMGADWRRGMGVDEQRGFGMEVDQGATRQSPLKVRTVYPGGPAQTAGIYPGDLITHIKGDPVKKCGLATIHVICPSVQGEEGEISQVSVTDKVEVTYESSRDGGRPLTVTLSSITFQPETILGVVRRDDNSWNYWLDHEKKIAHIRVSGMGNTTAIDLRTTLDKLREEGLRALILDLRWCPGGYLRQAIQIASLFVGEGLITTVSSRTEGDTKHTNTLEKTYRDFAMAVLINSDSSGGAELIAAALQDHKRAVIVGTRSLGKGSIQIHMPLGLTDAGFKLTTRTLVRPSGKPLHRFPDSQESDDWGVRPHVEVRVSTELNQQLKEWWQLQTLRPGSRNERLPLDDPQNDPQRQTALDEVLKKTGK